jgi:hypothetical protein
MIVLRPLLTLTRKETAARVLSERDSGPWFDPLKFTREMNRLLENEDTDPGFVAFQKEARRRLRRAVQTSNRVTFEMASQLTA